MGGTCSISPRKLAIAASMAASLTGEHLALRVGGGGGHTQQHGRVVGLVGVEQGLRKLGRLAEGERQKPARHRVEGTGVTALCGAQQPAGLLKRIVGADADRFVEKQHTVDDAARRAALGGTGQTKDS
jgi:hypothetical protein